MPNLSPFTIPSVEIGTAYISVTGTSAAAEIPGTGAQILVSNVGATECFIVAEETEAAAVATAQSTLSMPGNTSKVFTVGSGTIWVGAITASGTTTLRIARGDGY